MSIVFATLGAQASAEETTCRNPNLGLATKARGCKVAGQKGDPGACHMPPGVQRV